jgi:hypothetical protein
MRVLTSGRILRIWSGSRRTALQVSFRKKPPVAEAALLHSGGRAGVFIKRDGDLSPRVNSRGNTSFRTTRERSRTRARLVLRSTNKSQRRPTTILPIQLSHKGNVPDDRLDSVGNYLNWSTCFISNPIE